MQAIVGILFLLPNLVYAMDVKPELQAPKAAWRGSLSVATDQISCSARNPASIERSAMGKALSSNIAAPGDGAQAMRNSKHKRTESAPLPINTGTPKLPAPTMGISNITPLNLAAISPETPSVVTATTAKSENENGEIAAIPGGQKPVAVAIVPEYVSAEWINLERCIRHLHEVMQLYIKPGTIFYEMHKEEKDKKKYFTPILLRTAQELHHDKIGRYKKALPKIIDALLETYYPSSAHYLTHSVSSGAAVRDQTDRKERAVQMPPPGCLDKFCVIM